MLFKPIGLALKFAIKLRIVQSLINYGIIFGAHQQPQAMYF
jgi:hypothetical protein